MSTTGTDQLSSCRASRASRSSMRAMRPRQMCSSSASIEDTDRTAFDLTRGASRSRPWRRFVNSPTRRSTARASAPTRTTCRNFPPVRRRSACDDTRRRMSATSAIGERAGQACRPIFVVDSDDHQRQHTTIWLYVKADGRPPFLGPCRATAASARAPPTDSPMRCGPATPSAAMKPARQSAQLAMANASDGSSDAPAPGASQATSQP